MRSYLFLLAMCVGVLLLPRGALSRCTPGCLKCEGNNICSVCDATSLYVLSNGECVKQNLEFCLLSFNLFSCLKCYPGFYLELNGKCVKNPEHSNQIPFCKEYESFTRCKTCNQFYYLADEGKRCERIAGEVIQDCVVYESDSICKICGDYILSTNKSRCDPPEYEDEQCMFYSDKTSCRECKEGFYFDKNYYIRHIKDTYQYLVQSYKDYFMNQESTVNVPVCERKTLIEKCAEPLGNHKCKVCQDGYFINDTFDQCIENPPKAEFFRTDNITNCYLHNKTNVIRNNVEVLNIECILCYEDYYKAVNNRKCMKHTSRVNNCKTMSQTTDQECILCENGYYRKDVGDEKCQQRVDINDKCEKYHLLSEACETCIDPTYIKHYEEKFCSPPIPECKIYETSGTTLSCKQCNFGYFFDTEDGVCEANSIFDPYCAYYNEKRECQECYFGFYYDLTQADPTCQPNTPEYVEKARCQEFHPLNKNECIGCKSSATTIKLQYTCKAFSPEVKDRSEARDYIAFCKRYEITTSGTFKCLEALDEVQHDDESLKKVYVLVTDEEKAYKRTSVKIQYCDLHERVYKTSGDALKCAQCYKTRKINTFFDYDNVSNLTNCTEQEQDTGYCVKFFSSIKTCRDYRYYNINQHHCPNFGRVYDQMNNPSDDDVRMRACPWYWSSTYPNDNSTEPNDNSTYPKNNCNVQGDERDFQCYSRDDAGNCNIWHFFQNGMGVQFWEEIEFEIVISPDRHKCLQYNHFELENDANCVQKSDDELQCLLCRKDYYSIPTKTFTYELDSVESYISKINEPDFVDGCIKFNKVTTLCERCAPGKFLSRNTCVTCDGNNLAIDYTGLTCLQFVDTNFPNTCKRISTLGTTTYCVECKDGWVGQLNFDVDIVVPVTYFPTIDGAESMIEIDSESLSYKQCIDSNDLFYYIEDYKHTLKNCLFFQVYNDVTYCLGCKFGFTGEVYLTPNDFLTIQNCAVDADCDLSVTYPLDNPEISSLVTCHQCTDTSKIPTYRFFYTTGKDVDTPAFIYDNDDKKTMTCESPVVSNCLIQVASKDETVKAKWNDGNPNNDNEIMRCVYCKPMYSPSYSDTQEDFFPYRYIDSCNFISNCEKSLKPNHCEQCQNSSRSPDQNDMRLKIDNGVSSCEYNNYVEEDPFCNLTEATSPSGVCDQCKDGFVYLNFKCIALNVTNCKYFRASACVESTKELDEMKSMMWREYNSDYVIKTINCLQVETTIDNCEYYISETECHQCKDGFTLGNDSRNCYERNTENCIEYSDMSMICVKCAPGFDIANGGICAPAKSVVARGCSKYSDLFCAECLEPNYFPIKIKLNQTSICMNATITPFCEEIDEQQFFEDKILTCKTCKFLKDFESVGVDDDFDIDNYDFHVVGKPFYSDEMDLKKVSDLWGHYTDTRNYFNNEADYYNPDLKFALFKYDYNVCQEYTSIDNCLRYDDADFDKTFNCIECTADYYLNANECIPRVPEAFCIEYFIDSNNCKRFVDTWDYSIKLSTFDIFVIANSPPKKSENEVQDEGIEGCIDYFDAHSCKACNRTTYLYDNLCLTVTTIVPQCEVYSRNGLCTECSGELLLFQNKCLPKYSSNCDGFLSNTRCDRCPVDNPYMQSGSCQKNPDVPNCDRYSNVNSCFFCDDAFSRSQNGLCELKTTYIPNCKKHLVGPFCSECEDNYVLINNQCVLNPNYDRNCKTFAATSECNVCQFNFYFKEGQCFECKTDSFKCLFCNPDNPNQCELCKPGFFMNNEKTCVAIPDYTQTLIALYQESTVSAVSRLGLGALLLTLALYLFNNS